MAAPVETPSPAPVISETTKMSKAQKLAALLVMLGPDSAAQVLKNLEENEVEAIAAEMAKLTLVSQELQREILREFSEVAVQASAGLRGGVEFTRQTLEKALGL